MVPLILVFAIWLAYGVWQWRDNRALLAKLSKIPRKRRPIHAALLFFGAAGLLMAALFALTAAGGLSPQEVKPWAWPIIALVGLAFVHAQTRAGALLVSLAVTPPPSEPSTDSEGSG